MQTARENAWAAADGRTTDGKPGDRSADERPSDERLRSLLRPQHGRDLEAGTQTCRGCGVVQRFEEFEYRVSQNCLLRDCRTCVAKRARSPYVARARRR